jgi:hypothetical protein
VQDRQHLGAGEAFLRVRHQSQRSASTQEACGRRRIRALGLGDLDGRPRTVRQVLGQRQINSRACGLGQPRPDDETHDRLIWTLCHTGNVTPPRRPVSPVADIPKK